MDQMVRKFKRVKTTKGTVMYGELDANGKVIDTYATPDAAVVGSLYVRKAQMGDGAFPELLEVTIRPIA